MAMAPRKITVFLTTWDKKQQTTRNIWSDDLCEYVIQWREMFWFVENITYNDW